MAVLVTTLDENGVAVRTNGTGPAVTIAPGSSFPPAILAMTSGAFDGDDRDDLITVTAIGSVHFHRNLGSSRPDRASFAPDVLVDSLLAGWPISPMFVNYAFPAMTTCDLDEDGILDVLLAGGPVNRVAGNTIPGVVAFYRGLGGGTFQAMHHTLSGSAIDLEVADLDGNGHVDHVVREKPQEPRAAPVDGVDRERPEACEPARRGCERDDPRRRESEASDGPALGPPGVVRGVLPPHRRR